MRKVLLLLMLLLTCCLPVPAQKGKTQRKPAVTQKSATRKTTGTKKQVSRPATTRKKTNNSQKKQPVTIKGLENERKALRANKEANIRKQEQLKKGVKQGMENLMILDQEIAQKRKVIDTIRNDVTRLTEHIRLLDHQLEVLAEELEERRMRYMQSMRYMHRNRSVQNQLMFVFSAENFNQMYRRLRFTREYATYQKAQGEAVKSKQEQVEQKKQELAASKQQKSTLLARGEKEQQLLEGKQSEQQAQVNQLKKQQKTVEALILEQQRREEELNARIDKLIAEELARERARQEAEARRKAEAERKRAAAEEASRREAAQTETKSKTKSKGTGNKQNHHVAETKPTPREVFLTPAEDIRMSGNFEANRGRLPLPITGAYQLVRGFGPYSPEGLSRVRLQSNGWYLKGQGGAKAQCIFDGEVSGVYYQYGSYIVTVRHGKYISAYINLHSVNVKKGQRVKTHDVLGGLGGDNIMQFQLRNWSTLLNPSQWLRR